MAATIAHNAVIQGVVDNNSSMLDIKLSYLDFPEGRGGEAERLAFHLGGIAFEDDRFRLDDVVSVVLKAQTMQVSMLQVGELQFPHQDAVAEIARYVGRITHLYPNNDPLQALLCDVVLRYMENVLAQISATCWQGGDIRKTARHVLVTRYLPTALVWLQTRLEIGGGEYFANQSLTIADLKVFTLVRGLNSGRMEHIPTDLVAQYAPQLNSHLQRIELIPAVMQYYARSSKSKSMQSEP